MMVPTVLVRLLLPTAALISVYFLLRGHNEPGGGFVGGLIFATAVILQYMAGGVYWVESRSRLNPQNWIGIGLLFAGSAAMAAWLAYKPFLAALAWDIALPLIGHVHLSSVLLFDLGVYMLVVGPRCWCWWRWLTNRCARNARPPPKPGGRRSNRGSLMELIYAVAIGVLAGSGVWLLLRPRTFQFIMGLSLVSYAVNLFIFGMGRLTSGRPPVVDPAAAHDPSWYADPLPQALVLTAIVIGFATTALFLVVLLASRGLTGTDHVDGRESQF